jgi:recombination protein RecT
MSTALATTDQAPQTPAAAVRTKLDAFMGSLAKRNENLTTLLSDSGIDPAKFLEVARRAISNNPDLLNCTTESLMRAFINAATDGLPPDGRDGAIVSYNQNGAKVAQWQPMYQGLLKVAYRSGNFMSIEARVVYAGDEFSYRLGDDPFIHHVPKPRAAGMKPAIVNSYAVAKTTNGGVFREVFEAEDIRKVNAVSRATKGPGKDWPEEMARKGPLRRMWKFLPKDRGMERIADHDNETFDLQAVHGDASAGPKLAPGFRPALVQTADQVMPAHRGEPDAVYAAPSLDDTLDGDFIPQHEPEQAPVGREAPVQEAGDEPASEEGAAGTSSPTSTIAGMKRGSDLLAEQQSAPAHDDPLEWKVAAIGYVEAAGSTVDLKGLDAQWTADGSWARLKAASKTDWNDLVLAMRDREAELVREEGRG